MKYLFVSLITALFLFTTPISSQSGVEPSPFQPEINQLGAVVNVLDSANYRIIKVMAVPPDPCFPPDPCEPGPDLNGAVNKLEAINKQLISVDDMVSSMIEEVMGFEPMPFRADLLPALEAVGDASLAIADDISLFAPPDPCHPDFRTALDNVADSALYITETVEWGIDNISSGECEPMDLGEVECGNTIGCEWITDTASVEYCCCIR